MNMIGNIQRKWCDEKIKIEDLNMETQHITYEKNYKIIITW